MILLTLLRGACTRGGGGPADCGPPLPSYAPLSVRLVERAMEPGGWREAEAGMRLLPGETREVRQEASIATDDGARAQGPPAARAVMGKRICQRAGGARARAEGAEASGRSSSCSSSAGSPFWR